MGRFENEIQDCTSFLLSANLNLAIHYEFSHVSNIKTGIISGLSLALFRIKPAKHDVDITSRTIPRNFFNSLGTSNFFLLSTCRIVALKCYLCGGSSRSSIWLHECWQLFLQKVVISIVFSHVNFYQQGCSIQRPFHKKSVAQISKQIISRKKIDPR